jgi:AraC-like DNA-binding protein
LRPEIRSEFGKRSEASQLRIATICQALIDELEKPSNGSRFCTRLLVWNLLAEVVREHRPGTKTIPLQSASTMQKMQNVMHYVTENLSGSITFREACKRSGLGSTQFVKRCKDIFGMTFFQYVTSCRLEAARNEILNSKEKLKIEYVAKRWGFYDASHFLRAYRKQYGHGPVQEQAQR